MTVPTPKHMLDDIHPLRKWRESITSAVNALIAGGGGGGLTQEQIQDMISTFLVAGSNITLTYNDGANTLTVDAAGGGSSANVGTVDVDFGATETDVATATVSAPWVTSTSKIVCAPAAIATTDHDPEDYALEGITAYATNIQNGVGFDVIASAPNLTFGKFTIHYIGI